MSRIQRIVSVHARSLIAIAVLGAHLTPARADCIGGPNPEDVIGQLVAAPYSRLERPDSDGPPTKVATQLYLESLNSVDEKGNAVDVSGYWRMSWKDQRLNFTSVEDGGCFDSLNLPLQGSGKIPLESPDVWVPDLYFSTALSESYGSNFLQVSYTGSVYVSARFKHSFKCVMDFSEMPFDRQKCTIDILSYTEDASMVELSAKDDLGIELPEAGVWLPAWKVSETGHRFHVQQYGTGENAMQWHTLKLDFTLERSSGYHIMNDVLYGILFVAMSWTGFFVARTNAPARVALSLLPVLTMLNHIRGVQSQLPRISEMTWLSAFLLVSLIYNVAAVLEYGLVSSLLSKEDARAERLRVLRALSAHLGEAYERQLTQRSTFPPLADEEEEAVDLEVEEGDPRRKVCKSLSGLHVSSLLPTQQRTVHAAMRLFDDGDGIVSRVEMRRGLRHFNIYYTAEQVTEIFATMGVEDGQGMPMSTFLKYLKSMTEPSPTLQKGFLDKPPSMQLDIAMRYGFLLSYILVLVTMVPTAASTRP
ncbi:unnamed protein product [Prorocentrum cordatum]|uniref:Neurotransmitter-gated ion-channel ligand-binding domain-containing protein n=1 Tax=Prorocentrum cordatum TaxID=2364126 RepID=A0ABN9URD9_9DINO|nr:unnamed protein product [Polarella glacialis]